MHARPLALATLLLLAAPSAPVAAELGPDFGPNLIQNFDFGDGFTDWTAEAVSYLVTDYHGGLEAPQGTVFARVGFEYSQGTFLWQCVDVEADTQYEVIAATRPITSNVEDLDVPNAARIVLVDVTGQACPAAGSPPERDDAFATVTRINPPKGIWSPVMGHVPVPPGVTKVAVGLHVCCGYFVTDSDVANSYLFRSIYLRRLTPRLGVGMATSDTSVAPLEDVEIEIELSGFNGVDQPEARIFHDGHLSLVSASCSAGSVVDVTQGGDRFFKWFGVPDFDGAATTAETCNLVARATTGFAGPFDLVAVADCAGTASCFPAPSVEDTVGMGIVAAPDVGVDLTLPTFPEAGRTTQIDVELANDGTATAGPVVTLSFSPDLPILSLSSGCAGLAAEPNFLTGQLFLAAGEVRNCVVTFDIPAEQQQAPLVVDLDTATSSDYDAGNDDAGGATRIVHLRVDRMLDGPDPLPGDGICAIAAGGCTLRAAVMEASALPVPATGGPRVIEIPYSPFGYRLSHGGAGPTHGDLDVARSMVLRGLRGAGGLRPILSADLPAGFEDRLIRIVDASRVAIEDLVFVGQDVSPPDDATNGHGGLIHHADGELRLTDVVLRGGATDGSGGAIYSAAGAGGHLTIERTEIFDNRAGGGGGAIFFAGNDLDLVFGRIHDSDIHDNEALLGGGVMAAARLALVEVERSSLHGNVAEVWGGALYALRLTSVLIDDSTISGNGAGQRGGGIHVSNSDSGSTTPLTIRRSTVVYNAAAPADDEAGEGGGIFAGVGSDVELHGSILAFNTAQVTGSPPLVVPHGANCSGTVTSEGYNSVSAVSLDALCDFVAATGDAVNVAPSLGPLAANGGPTPTHALLAPGQEVDRGDPACDSGVDQRGLSRPRDGDGDGVARCDKGAYEIVPAEPLFTDGFESGDTSAWSWSS